MTDYRLHTSERRRVVAAELRRILMRLDNAEQFASAGIDLLNVLDAPMSIGDPLTTMDSALHLAEWLRHPRLDVLNAATAALRERVRGGWKCSEQITGIDAALAITRVLLRVHLANLEKAPA